MWWNRLNNNDISEGAIICPLPPSRARTNLNWTEFKGDFNLSAQTVIMTLSLVRWLHWADSERVANSFLMANPWVKRPISAPIFPPQKMNLAESSRRAAPAKWMQAFQPGGSRGGGLSIVFKRVEAVVQRGSPFRRRDNTQKQQHENFKPCRIVLHHVRGWEAPRRSFCSS